MVDNNEEDRLMNAEEVANYTGLSESLIRKKALAGEIPSVKIGDTRNAPRRFWRSKVKSWVQSFGDDR